MCIVHSCTHWQSPPPPPGAFGHIYEGAIGQPTKTTSLCDPLVMPMKRPEKGEIINVLVYASPLHLLRYSVVDCILLFKGRGTLLHWGSLYFSFHRKWSKLGTLVQKESKETEMKKKFRIFDCAPCYWT
jgi:hypothetical protein